MVYYNERQIKTSAVNEKVFDEVKQGVRQHGLSSVRIGECKRRAFSVNDERQINAHRKGR